MWIFEFEKVVSWLSDIALARTNLKIPALDLKPNPIPYPKIFSLNPSNLFS